MKRIFIFFLLVVLASCNPGSSGSNKDIISVSIAPFEYFIKEIAGNDFDVNVIVPAGANPHNYEPYPEQINYLSRSKAYISNGYMGFEEAWLNRLYKMNKNMVKLSLGDNIVPLYSIHSHENDKGKGIDPHYWVSPKCAYSIATSVKDLLCTLNPDKRDEYGSNYNILNERISELDRLADSLFSDAAGHSFLIYHPNLAYIARDYNLNEIAIEFEGKEPPPSRFKELIDIAVAENIKTIFVQKEYDKKYAGSIADEINADIIVIDPLAEDWYGATKSIITGLYRSFTGNTQTE